MTTMALIKTPTVEEEKKKNPELREADLELLREWRKKQPHLPSMSDYELILFLHSNYYRIESTKITIDTYFTIRTHVPEFFTNRDPLSVKEIREIMKVVCCIPLPGTTREGYKVLMARLIDPEPSHYVFSDAIKLLCMTMDLWLYTHGTNSGHIILMDMHGVMFGHVARLNPVISKKYFCYLQEALPVRLKGLHFMNVVPFMDTLLSMMKPFMKKELLDTLHLHTGLETLNKKIPLDILSNEQGGKAGPLKDLWAAQVKKIEDHRAWFLQEEIRKVNEAVRPPHSNYGTGFFGVEGSFKKLDID